MSVPPPPAPSAPPLPLECATASCTRVRRRHSLASSPPPFVLASPASASASASVPASPLRAELPRLPSHREAPVCPLRSDRLAVLASHLSCSSPMASEKESALATDPTGGATVRRWSTAPSSSSFLQAMACGTLSPMRKLRPWSRQYWMLSRLRRDSSKRPRRGEAQSSTSWIKRINRAGPQMIKSHNIVHSIQLAFKLIHFRVDVSC